jgi:hypothetical protein
MGSSIATVVVRKHRAVEFRDRLASAETDAALMLVAVCTALGGAGQYSVE